MSSSFLKNFGHFEVKDLVIMIDLIMSVLLVSLLLAPKFQEFAKFGLLIDLQVLLRYSSRNNTICNIIKPLKMFISVFLTPFLKQYAIRGFDSSVHSN